MNVIIDLTQSSLQHEDIGRKKTQLSAQQATGKREYNLSIEKAKRGDGKVSSTKSLECLVR